MFASYLHQKDFCVSQPVTPTASLLLQSTFSTCCLSTTRGAEAAELHWKEETWKQSRADERGGELLDSNGSPGRAWGCCAAGPALRRLPPQT